ncbi:MAG TPA: dihydrolipoyl dehydrogenase [Verrucomicrobiae bacterium]|nr:dihydrolipoyl dehydrogenase [Verrucomicrobiae bacterium]
MSEHEFDVAVIGGGSGGYAAARVAAAAGLRTVVIEGGVEIGGLCILRGCMPTKALLHAAEVLHQARRASVWGLRPGKIDFDYAAVMTRKRAMIDEFAGYRRQQLTDGRFTFLRAKASFIDSHTLALDNGQKLVARSFVISTGSMSADPPHPFLAEAGYITSDEALALERPPKSLIVLGGGAVAVEFAQFFARFDVKVSLVQRGPHVLRDFDPDAASVIEEVFRREDIDLYTVTKALGAGKTATGKYVEFEQDGAVVRVEAEEILFALGRRPNTDGLNLAAAGVKTDDGRIITDAHMQTSAPHVYAAGDCAGPFEIVHIAIQQGEVAAHNLAHPATPRKMDYRLITSVVFTDPQVATVGLTEQEAKLRGVPVIAASYPFNDHGKSLIMEARDGFVKLLADPRTGEILGGACVGPMGGELIHEIIAAMHKRMTVRELANMPHYHPTLAEIWTYPAEELADQVSAP